MLIPDSIKRIYAIGVTEGIINGCGQKGRISFSQLFLALENVEDFIPEKGKQCFREIEYGCGVHDILCEFGGTRTMKLVSDLWFSLYVKDRICWTGFIYRNVLCLGLFVGLHFYGKDAGNFVK